MKDRLDLEKILNFGRKIEFEVNEIHHETPTGILIEWNRQNAWFPKDKVKILSENGTIKLRVPKWLFERKFS